MSDLEHRLDKALKTGDRGDLRKARQENDRMAKAPRNISALAHAAKGSTRDDGVWDALLDDILEQVKAGLGS